MVCQVDAGVLALLYGIGDVTHQGVEGLGPFHYTYREGQLNVSFPAYRNGNFVLVEQVPGIHQQLQGIPQVNGDRHGVAEALIYLEAWMAPSCRQHPGSAGKMHRHGVNVNPGNCAPQPVQNGFGVELGRVCPPPA